MTDFTGNDFAGPPLDANTFNVTAAANIHQIGLASSSAFNIPTAQDLSDVNFTPTLIPSMRDAAGQWKTPQAQAQAQGRGGRGVYGGYGGG